MVEKDEIEVIIERAIEEDLRGGVDVTSEATISEDSRSKAHFVAKSDGILAGIDVAKAVMKRLGVETFSSKKVDGDSLKKGDVIATVEGSTRDILLAERTALNLLCRMSGIATLTHRWVDAISGTKAKIRDTRKTTPGLRSLEKYAVRVGGGMNHRSTLSESALIKDNHIVAAGSITAAFKAVRGKFPAIEVEVEVDTLDQLREALACGAQLILLDNMSVETTKEAVAMTQGRAKLESSGGLSLSVAKEYAECGVDYLAVGALTHSAQILDISLDFVENKENQ
jgi:nicotinate-nucleotide pyrophosphorylase (carboxylating)